MNGKKILALLTAIILVLTFASCGGKTPAEPETQPIEDVTAAEVSTDAAVIDEDATEMASEAVSAADETAAAADEETTEAADEETTEAEKKVPETKEEIVDFYKKAAAETDKGKVTCQTKMEMTALDGGSGVVGSMINLFKPIAKSALEKNSKSSDGITGGYQKLTADDVASATAKDDGKYTTIHMTLKQQVDGMNGQSKEGHVGHAISVLPGVQSAIDELNGMDVDASEGTIQLTYNNAYVDVKIDNATGKIVSGTWHFNVDILIDNVKAKIGIASATLHGATGTVQYTVTL